MFEADSLERLSMAGSGKKAKLNHEANVMCDHLSSPVRDDLSIAKKLATNRSSVGATCVVCRAWMGRS